MAIALRRGLRTTAALLGIACANAAQADAAAALLACRVIADIGARVACYDAIPVPDGTAGAAGRQVQPATAAPALRSPGSGAAVGNAAAVSPEASFGLEARVTPTTVDILESRIDGRFEGWSPRSRLLLANGQLWEVAESTRAAFDLQRPAVRITRGSFGSFFMEIEGVPQTPRVRRIR